MEPGRAWCLPGRATSATEPLRSILPGVVGQDTLYCFSCGRPVPGGQAVPFCNVCSSSGPQLTGKSLRWVVRGGTGIPRGALAYEEIIDLLAREAMTEEVEVAREGGTWCALVEHPDFRGVFLPGTEQSRAFEDLVRSLRSTRRSQTARRQSRYLFAGVAMVGSIGLAVFSATTGLLTIPEPIANRITGWFGSMTEQVSDNVDFSREDKPHRVKRDLPGEELFALLPPPARDEPLPILLQSGWRAWWSGTDAGLAEARIAFESAAVRAPEDVEALGALVEIYADFVAGEPDLKDAMSYALTRMMLIDAQANATLRARAADARAAGQDPLIVGILASCGSPVTALFETVDLGCAVRLAEARGDDDSLAALQERSGSTRISMIRARSAVMQKNWGVALDLSRQLVQSHPAEADPWSVLARAAAATGDWRTAESAAAEAVKRAPHLTDLAHLRAKILLRVLSRERDALAVLQGLISEPRFAQYANRISVLNDAAEAAMVTGKSSLAQTFAASALEIDPTDPVALIQQAWLYHLAGENPNAEESLRRVDSGQLRGPVGAQVHLGVARVYLSMDNQRSAVSEIQSALRNDSSLIAASLDGALADIRVNNLDAAVEKVTRAPLKDVVYAANLSPLAPIWVPPADMARLKNEMGTALSNDVRYSVRLKEILAILDWFAGKGSAESGLRIAVQEGGTTGASAALAQQLFANNRPGEALKYVDEVLTTEADDPIFLSMRGYAQATAGDVGAERSLGRALSLEPMNPVVLYWNASANEVMGKKTEARRSLEALLTVSPDDVTTRARLISMSEE
jgi:tetratricopeptide (TPR) repeat protein